MKFGILVDFNPSHTNIGSFEQSIAIEYLYEIMKIPKDEILYITSTELITYEGEQLLLPYSYALHFLLDPKDGSPKLSNKIIPVFLGISIELPLLINSYPLENFLQPERGWITLFEKFSPIGCQDEFTHNFLKSYGISSHVQGCITNIFPQRKDGIYTKLVLIDSPHEIIQYIPSELLKTLEVCEYNEYKDGLSIENGYEKIKNRYKYYKDNAAFIITSNYNVAIPCNAMGINSVYTIESIDKYSIDVRYDFFNSNIQICTSDRYSAINWSPKWNDFKECKQEIAELAISKINKAYEKYTGSKYTWDFQPGINNFDTLLEGWNSHKPAYTSFLHE